LGLRNKGLPIEGVQPNRLTSSQKRGDFKLVPVGGTWNIFCMS
jgi:hypothetical protein